MTSIEIKARMFDLQKEADRVTQGYERSVKPLRDEYHKLANELQKLDELEMTIKKADNC